MKKSAMPPNAAETQSVRRARFGLNITVALLAAAAVAVLANFMVVLARQQQGLTVRLDLTATRRYSLSAQTTRVLRDLAAPHRLVTLIASGGLGAEQQRLVDQVNDLVDEYAARCPQIAATHINPALELARYEAFVQELAGRFDEQIVPARAAIQAVGQALMKLSQTMVSRHGPAAGDLQDSEGVPEPLGQLLTTLRRAFTSQSRTLDQTVQRLDRALEESLPQYGALGSELESALGGLVDRLYQPAAEQLRQWAARPTLAAAVRDSLLQQADACTATAADLDALIASLRDMQVPDEYQQLASDLARQDVVAIVGPEKVRVLSLSDMYRQPSADVLDPTAAEFRFVGEQVLTGALIGMTLQPPPLVVFVYSGRTPALGPGGQANYVAEQLRKLDFDVRQWSPAPVDPGGFGQARPTPAPEPAEGQAAVWVILPAESAGPMNFAGTQAQDQVVNLLKRRQAVGDSVMVTLSATPAAAFQPDPVAQLLAEWGLDAQLDRVVVYERALPDQQSRTMTQHMTTTWPEDSPLAGALQGSRAMFVWAAPLNLRATDGLSVHPLASVSQPQMWAEPVADAATLTEARYDPSAAPTDGRFTIAAAVEKAHSATAPAEEPADAKTHRPQRLMAVADAVWLNDQVTTYGEIPGLGGGAGLAEAVGAAFPGNAELFTNGVFWLADLDELIAATPRSQDIRRVQPMTPATMNAARWALLAGLPGASFVVGLSVWRRRRA